MVGSYPPKETVHAFTTPEEDVPAGALARGTYTVHSLFTDDDKNEHLKVSNRTGRLLECVLWTHTPNSSLMTLKL